MSKRYILFVNIAIALSVGIAASAASLFDITFPIPELGNCANREECKSYCDDLSHADACSAFATAHGIGNAQSAKQAAALPDSGPGGCKTATECKTYCDDTAHFDECISFAEAHGLMSKKEIREARKPISKGPGGCKTQEECKSYCSDEGHELACADSARKQGQISDGDYNVIKQVATNGGPGGCKGHQECQDYCKDAAHLEECLSFAEEHGFVSHDNADTIRKAGVAGPGPGGCQGNDACRQYCSSPNHQQDCLDFGETHGLINKEEASTARKLLGKTGPGGCQGKDECQTYCSDPSHTEECLANAQQNGVISSQEATQARAFVQTIQQGGPGGCKSQQDCQSYCQDPAHREECFDFAKRRKLITPDDEKEFQGGLQIRKTVEQNGGPGGCKNDQECKSYCSDPAHTEECIAFAAAHGGISEDRAQAMLQQFTAQNVSAQGDIAADTLQQSQQNSVTRFEEFKQLERQFRPLGVPGAGFNQDQREGGFNPPPGSIPGQKPGEGGPVSAQTTGGVHEFIGPGGCTGAAGCISYCAEHKDECFNQAPEDKRQPGQLDNQGNQAPGVGGTEFSRSKGQKEGVPFQSGPPQLRANIVHELKSDDLPQNFEQRSSEEKHQFFKEKFQEFRRHEDTGLPDTSPQGFPGGDQTRKQFQPPRGQFQQREQGQPPRPPGFDRSQDETGQGGSDSFRGMKPQSGSPGIFAPLEGKDQFPNAGQHQDSFPEQQQSPNMQDKGSFGRQRNFRSDQKQFTPQGMTNPSGTQGFSDQDQKGQPSGGGIFPGRSPFPFGGSQGQEPDQQMPAGFNSQNQGSFGNQQWQAGQTQGGQFQPPTGVFPQGGATGGSFQMQPGQQFPTGSTGSFQPPPGGSPFPMPSSGSFVPPQGSIGTGSFPPPPPGSFGGTFQQPTGQTGGFTQPTDGSPMPPPPSGSTGGSMPPRPSGDTSGGSQPPPPPPSGFGPLNAYFAALLQTLFTR